MFQKCCFFFLFLSSTTSNTVPDCYILNKIMASYGFLTVYLHAVTFLTQQYKNGTNVAHLFVSIPSLIQHH